jgi:hypothetical protein
MNTLDETRSTLRFEQDKLGSELQAVTFFFVSLDTASYKALFTYVLSLYLLSYHSAYQLYISDTITSTLCIAY